MELVQGKYYLFVKYSNGEPVDDTYVVEKRNNEWVVVHPVWDSGSLWDTPKALEEYREVSPEEVLVLRMSQ